MDLLLLVLVGILVAWLLARFVGVDPTVAVIIVTIAVIFFAHQNIGSFR